MTDTVPVDYTTDVGLIRALIPDVELLQDMVDPAVAPSYIFHDPHLQSFLDLEGDSVKRAAALALETLGSSEALVSKVIKTEDLQTDGAKVMAQFLARAKELRAQADADDAVLDGNVVFEVVPYTPYPYTYGYRC
jgi:hypothetical protein